VREKKGKKVKNTQEDEKTKSELDLTKLGLL